MFSGDDLDVFQTLSRGEFSISGFQNKDLAQRLHKAGRQVSGYLKEIWHREAHLHCHSSLTLFASANCITKCDAIC
jgi:hypothetical protein